MKKIPKLLISLGDPFSVNIELVHKLLQNGSDPSLHTVLVGSYFHWKDQTQKILPQNNWVQSSVPKPGLYFLDIGGVEKSAPLLSPKERGEIAVKALHAIEPLLNENTAVLTCPIDKFAANEAGFHYPGHTEYFTSLAHCESLMLLAGPRLRVGLATNHLAVRNLPEALTSELIQSKISILYKTLQSSFGIPSPGIAVCGFNPHCSDGGLFGDEEERILKPAIRSFSDENISGPYPADTVFYRAFHGHFDAVLAMYHDQGLGPLKTVHFDEAINMTCGLPFLRVSPDHGPAKDLFLQGKASTRSMEEAYRLCLNYLEGKNL